jgi:hypothetical protein
MSIVIVPERVFELVPERERQIFLRDWAQTLQFPDGLQFASQKNLITNLFRSITRTVHRDSYRELNREKDRSVQMLYKYHHIPYSHRREPSPAQELHDFGATSVASLAITGFASVAEGEARSVVGSDHASTVEEDVEGLLDGVEGLTGIDRAMQAAIRAKREAVQEEFSEEEEEVEVAPPSVSTTGPSPGYEGVSSPVAPTPVTPVMIPPLRAAAAAPAPRGKPPLCPKPPTKG